MNRFLALFALLGLAGCITNIDRVAPMSWTYYLGGGATEREIRVALLECGSDVPGDSREFYKPGGDGFLLPRPRLSDSILTDKCMQDAGFSYSGDKDTCTRWKDLPACKSDAVVPKRSTATRLNSEYCKLLPQTALCQPNYDPRAPQPKAAVDTRPVSINIAPSTSQAVKLQEQVQKDSNAQMNQLPKGVGTKK